jgi:hypothetical protein
MSRNPFVVAFADLFMIFVNSLLSVDFLVSLSCLVITLISLGLTFPSVFSQPVTAGVTSLFFMVWLGLSSVAGLTRCIVHVIDKARLGWPAVALPLG